MARQEGKFSTSAYGVGLIVNQSAGMIDWGASSSSRCNPSIIGDVCRLFGQTNQVQMSALSVVDAEVGHVHY
jgi:hypothetical protein